MLNGKHVHNMNTNIYKIKTKLQLVFAVIAVSWIVFGIISLTSINKIKKFHKLNHGISSITNSLQEMAESNAAMIQPKVLDEAFYRSGENEYTHTFSSGITTALNGIDSLLASDYFFYNKELSAELTELQASLQELDKNHSSLVEAILRKGNTSDGLIAEWRGQLSTLTDLGYQMNNMLFTNGINSLEETFSQYLENPTTGSINRITQLTEELKSNLSVPDTTGIINETMVSGANDALTALSTLSNEILEQDIIIGSINEGGLHHTINEQIASIQHDVRHIGMIIDNGYQQASKRSKTVIIIFWFLFTGMAISGYFLLDGSVVKPFHKIKLFAKDLSVGLTPGNLTFPNNDEIHELGGYFNKFSDSLDAKSTFASNLGKGIIDDDLMLLSDEDTLGKSLLSLKQTMIAAKQEEEKRNIENEKRRWINEGLAKFSDILRQNNVNMEKLTDSLITSLVKYLNATQGGLFLVNDDDKENIYLELKAAIAYNRRKFIDKKIELGEGLTGTCAVEKKSILLTEVPEEYLEITSGLGDANPNCILLVPLKLEDNTLGVVELASFNVFKDYEIEFVEKIGESIASTLTTVKVNERTAELLEKSQKQAAEMKEQEEEMRQNMEELQATQEEATRRENEITSIQNAINKTSLVVEYDMNGYIININDKFLEILDIPRNDIIGIHHSNFTSKNKTEKSYIEFWNKLQDGESITALEVIKLLNGKKLWLNQNYSPILNNEKKPYKVINIAVDITDMKQKEQVMDKKDRELARKTSEMDLLNKAINDSIIKCEYSRESIILDANENFAAIMGHPLNEMIGKNIYQFLSDEEKQVYDEIWPKLINNQHHEQVIKRILADGNIKYIMSSFTPVNDEENDIHKVFYLGQDITEQKLKYQLLEEANKEIERLKKQSK